MRKELSSYGLNQLRVIISEIENIGLKLYNFGQVLKHLGALFIEFPVMCRWMTHIHVYTKSSYSYLLGKVNSFFERSSKHYLQK